MTIRRVLLFVLLFRFRPPPRIGQRRREPSSRRASSSSRTPGYGDVGLDGNSIAILSRDGVLVFDTNGTPAAAAAVLAEIRKLTDQPVRWVVNSHWHWDHWYGTEVYQRAFPDVRIVAHEKTRAMMMGPGARVQPAGARDRSCRRTSQNLEKRAADEPVAASRCSTKTASFSSRSGACATPSRT